MSLQWGGCWAWESAIMFLTNSLQENCIAELIFNIFSKMTSANKQDDFTQQCTLYLPTRALRVWNQLLPPDNFSSVTASLFILMSVVLTDTVTWIDGANKTINRTLSYQETCNCWVERINNSRNQSEWRNTDSPMVPMSHHDGNKAQKVEERYVMEPMAALVNFIKGTGHRHEKKVKHEGHFLWFKCLRNVYRPPSY